MSDQLHAAGRVPASREGTGDLLGAELVWFAKAFAWGLLGSAIVSYVYLLQLGPRFLEDSDAPVRSYTLSEHVLAPFATLLNQVGFYIFVGWAALSLLPARLFIRRKRLGRCTLFAATFVSVWILIDFQIGHGLLSALGVLPFSVLCVALLACRFWPGDFFTPRKKA